MAASCSENVSQFSGHHAQFLKLFQQSIDEFEGGQISYYFSQWEALTSDKFILDTVLGATFIFSSTPPLQTYPPPIFSQISTKERLYVQQEITRLLCHKIVVPSEHEEGQFISPIFTTTNRDGSLRLILNLKTFNQYLLYQHFKMETLSYILKLVKPNCYMTSLDLKSAYYSVPMAPVCQNYLKFLWQDKLYKFVAFPNGLACCPRLFTKLLKPPLAHLRKHGHVIAAYLDDLYQQGDDFDDCVETVLKTIKTFTQLGFTIHPTKSSLIPSQIIEFLGFIINSCNNTVTISPDKTADISKCISHALNSCANITIRELAQCVGKIVAIFPAAVAGPLHYRGLERDKDHHLKAHKGNFDVKISLGEHAKNELWWWQKNIPHISKHILLL